MKGHIPSQFRFYIEGMPLDDCLELVAEIKVLIDALAVQRQEAQKKARVAIRLNGKRGSGRAK